MAENTENTENESPGDEDHDNGSQEFWWFPPDGSGDGGNGLC